MVTLADIALARYRLAAHLKETPIEHAPGLGEQVWLKLENTNPTHSFKIRGALNAVLALEPAALQRGLIAASSGNHAQALAYAARIVGAKATILMPIHTPQRKIAGVQRAGGEAVLFGDNYDQTEAEARRRAHETQLTYVSPYNDRHVVAGAGTIGLEILDQVPNVARVLVCTGGAGLVAGIATAIKALRPRVEVIAVCAEAAPALYNELYATQLPQQWDTLAEALSGEIEVGSLTIGLAQNYVDRCVLVAEAAINTAIRWMLSEQGWLIEGGGAVAVAALLSGAVPTTTTPTVAVVSGANIDTARLQQVLATPT